MTQKDDKKPAINELYQLGDFIDAKDNQGDWRVGFIVDKNDITKTFKIRFDGWAAKYDQMYRYGHPKLRQFRTFVLGYTGQKQLPALRPGWKFILAQHQDKLLQLHNYVVLQKEQKIKTTHQYNQWIRGHNYFYVDFLMTLTYSYSQQIKKVIQFFKLNILLCVNYLRYITQEFQTFISHLQKVNNQHIEIIDVAKSFAFYQIFDMVYTIAGSYQRLNQFFKDNEDLLRQELNIAGNKDVKQAYQIMMVTYFYKSSGFQYIDQILAHIKKLNKSISFVFLYSLAHLYSGLSCVIQTKVKQNILKSFKSITEKSIECLGDKQMKDFYQHQVIDLISQIVQISKRTSLQKQIESWSQVIQMEIYFKMMICPFFQKKLRGITLLQQFIEKKVQEQKDQQNADLIADGTINQWIQKKKLFDLLFSNDNPELIKKSTELFKYLYHRDNQMEKYIELIWKYRQGKHETALKQIYNFVGQIPIYDKNQYFTVQLFKKLLSQVPEGQWDPEYIKMIKDYTVNALFSFTGQDIKETLGFEILYKYSQKNPSDQIFLGYFLDICKKLQKTQFLQKFVVDCFKFIEKSFHTNFHVSLLVRILRQKLIDTRNIKLDGTAIVQQSIILSKNSQKQNLDQKFELLNEYLKKAKQIIPDENFIQFWNQMIDSKGRVSFFKWLCKIRDSGKVILTSFINSQTKEYLLQNFWTVEYFKNHRFDEYEAIFLLQLFKFVNDRQDRVRRDGLIIQILDENLTGIEKLHVAYKVSKNPKVTQILAKGLAEIYTSQGDNLIQLGIDLINGFIQRIVNETKQYVKVNDLDGVRKMIRLIEQIIARDEQIFDLNQNPKIESIKILFAKNSQNNEEKPFRVNLLQSMYSFKKLISDKFNLPIHKFDLIINDQQIVTYKALFKSIGQADIKGKILIKPRNKQQSKIKNQLNHHLQLLFELLGTKQIQQRVWNIVSKLPISNQIRQKIIQSQNPLKILQNKSFYKELYMFKAALSLDKKWWNIQAQQMIEFFMHRLKHTSSLTEIEREYIMVSAKLLQKVIQLDQISNSKFFAETFLALFQIVKRILSQTNQIQSLNPNYIRKFIETFFTIGDFLNKYIEKKSLKQTDPDALSLMLLDPNIQNLFKLCLIEYRHELIRKQFPLRLVKLATVNREKYANRLASIVLNELLDCTVQCPSKNLREYNLFSCYVLQTMNTHLQKFFIQNKSIFFYKLCKLIENQQAQKNSDTTNISLLCYISLCRYVIQQVSQEDLYKFFNYLYNECLFKGNLSKCKSKQTRTSVFNLLLKIIKYQKNAAMIFSVFGNLHINALWRSRKLQDWTITHSELLKSSTGYTGLKNLGCICYMNSFFQQIFMVQQFRRALLLSQDPSYDQKTTEDNLLYQVKKMFMNLMFSDKKSYNPKSFCISFKDYEGNPTNVNEQMDIDEFSGMLFDRLENSLKGTKHSNLIKDTFGGIFSNQIICKGCPHFSETEQSFLSLGLTVKDKRSIYESLQTMIKGDTLDGDNAYYCERCDKKVSAVKRVCLKQLPNHLIVSLKRFEFDFNTMTKLKINEFCEFPNQLNLEEYSYQYLRKKQNPKSFQGEEMKSRKYYEYKLKGVVIHIGYADSGHYYSLIQQRNGQQKWLQFNDSIVRKFNFQNLNDQAFGGQTGGLQSKQKIKNAYLLIYQRVQKINSIKQQVMSQGNSFLNMEMYKDVITTINKQNFEYNIQNILFSGEYLKFLLQMIEEAGRNKQNFQLQQFIIMAFFTTIIRSKTDPSTFEIIQKIYNSFGKGNVKLNEWILTQFCDLKIFDQLFRNCPIREIKRNLSSWTVLIIKQLPSDHIKINFLKTLVSKITTENENNIEAMTILHNLLDEDFCHQFLIQNNIIGRIHQNIIRRQIRYFGTVQKLVSATNQAPSNLGYQQIIQKTPFQLKKIKYDNESGIVWALIYKLISKYKKSQLETVLHPKQIEYLYLTKQKIYKLLQQSKAKFDMDVLTNYLCYLSEGNYEFSGMLIEMIQKGLKQFQSKRYRQFFELFKKLIAIQDVLTDQRISWIFCVIRSLKENQKYAMDCTIIELWLCKIINQNQKLRSYLIKQKSLLQYLTDLPLKKVPSDQLSKKNINFGENSVNKFHGIPFPISRRGYIKLLTHVQEFYSKLLKGIYQPIHLFESGNHIVYDKLGIGDKIAYFDIKDKVDYQEAVIKQVFVDKISIARKSMPNRIMWMWIEDEKLTSNLNVIKDQNAHELDSSKTTEMEDQINLEEATI